VEGGSEVAIELLKQPFHHIFFTGSTATGKKVMEAASAYLASVTLELGGKSPVVILPGADLKKTAAKVTWGKFVNAGQTCIAPDYVFVHEQAVDEFCELVGEQINKYYYKGKTLNTGDFGKIISASHFQRIKNLIEEGIASGGKVIVGGTFTESELRIHPTVIRLPYRKSKLMQEEIFGPVLPVLTYTHLPEVIDYINANNKPLALYVFGNSQEADALLNQTTSGGACVNDVMLQISNPHLPFGGVNSSGMGGSHGFHGFKTFSHERAVMYQARFFDFGSIIYPPYSGKERILKLLRKIM
jgi:aldehyde dehydrogenase (NAD+)